MVSRAARIGICFTVVGIPALVSTARGQGIAQGQNAFDNLIPTTERSPGGMVNSGIVRASEAVTPLEFTEIVETEPQLSRVDQFRLEAINVFAESTANVIIELIKRFFARAGYPIDESIPLPPGFDPSSVFSKSVEGDVVKSTRTQTNRD